MMVMMMANMPSLNASNRAEFMNASWRFDLHTSDHSLTQDRYRWPAAPIAKLEAQRLPRPAPRLVWIEADEPCPDAIEGAAEVVLLALGIGTHVPRRHQPRIVAQRLKLATEMMRSDAGLHADQARWHVGKPCLHLAARPLLAKHNGAAIIEADDVE